MPGSRIVELSSKVPHGNAGTKNSDINLHHIDLLILTVFYHQIRAQLSKPHYMRLNNYVIIKLLYRPSSLNGAATKYIIRDREKKSSALFNTNLSNIAALT